MALIVFSGGKIILSLHGTSHNPGGSDPITTGIPINQAIGDSAAEGTAVSLARSDHKHGIPAAATPVTQAFGDAAAAGAAATLSRSDHRHGMPASPSKIIDAAGVTKVDVEQAAAEKIVRMQVNSVEAFKLNADGILDLAKQSRCRAYKSAATQTISTNTPTIVVFDAESYDNQNEFDPTTNYRFTATKAGYYLISTIIAWGITTVNKKYVTVILKNGVDSGGQSLQASMADTLSCSFRDIIYLAANDYVEISVTQFSGVDQSINNGSGYTWLSIHKLS